MVQTSSSNITPPPHAPPRAAPVDGGNAAQRKLLPPTERRPAVAGQFACLECNGRFRRQEHLNRHVGSVHHRKEVKAHACTHCQKRFIRRDVLIRHYQSCISSKAAKSGSADEERSNRRDLLQVSENTYSHSKDKVQDSSTLTTSHELQSKQIPEVCDDPSVADELQSRTGPFLIDQISNGRQKENFSNVEEQNTPIDGQIHKTNPKPLRASSLDLPSTALKPLKKRGRYTSNACINCKKRKVKCTGEENCPQCRSTGLLCVYSHERKRRKPTSMIEISREIMTDTQERESPTAETQKISESLEHLMARIGNLERDRELYRSYREVSSADQDDNDGQWQSAAVDDDMQSNSGDSIGSLPPNEVNFGATCLFEPMQVLNRVVTSEGEAQSSVTSDGGSVSTTAPIRWDHLRYKIKKDFPSLGSKTRLNDVATMRHEIDIFFLHLNPHYPALNENQFRAQLEGFLVSEDTVMSNGDWQQFIALVNLMQAEVKILTDERPDLNQVPGWEEFCRAESLLHRLTWLGKGNLLTIQCLLCKARYLLYLERAGSAYHVMGQIVQLCFQLGLHNQSSWKNCSPFDIAMRQRIFWSIFYLERSISINSGLPYLIREADFKVDLLLALDDKLMFPGKPLPGETPETSSAPYLMSAVKWGRLGSEIWDVAFGINAERPASQEFVVSMDARINFIASQMPAHLQWQGDPNVKAGMVNENAVIPNYIHRQAIILYLRMNQLKLLLHQESMLSLKYDDATAENCVSIATSSIDTVCTSQHSTSSRLTDRFSSVFYIITCLLPLVCIIIRRDNVQQTRQNAIAAFQKGLSIVKGLSPNYSMARHALHRGDKIFTTALQAIERDGLSPSDTRPDQSEIHVLQYADSFNNFPVDFNWDMPGQVLNMPVPVPYDMNQAINEGFGDPAHGVSELWQYGFVDHSSMMTSFT